MPTDHDPFDNQHRTRRGQDARGGAQANGGALNAQMAGGACKRTSDPPQLRRQAPACRDGDRPPFLFGLASPPCAGYITSIVRPITGGVGAT